MEHGGHMSRSKRNAALQVCVDICYQICLNFLYTSHGLSTKYSLACPCVGVGYPSLFICFHLSKLICDG